MGPPENPTRHLEKQAASGRKRPVRRPRARCCLLKGCEQRFHPGHARQRYCSEERSKAAQEWAEWKARQKYRATAPAKQKRKQQRRRYRERVKERKPPEREVVSEAARVSPRNFFWMAAATGRAAMRASFNRRDRRYNDSVRMPAGVRWSASGNVSGVGKGGTRGAAIFLEGGRVRGSRESHLMSLTY